MSRAAATGTTLRAYLAEINAVPLLSAAEERALAARVAEGDPEARDHLARANLRLVVRIARDYLGRGLPLEDLVAEGNLGLMRAVEGFDPAAGTRFSTYAAYWIKQSIRGALMRTGRFVRLPAYVYTLLSKWRRAAAALAEQLGREPTDREVGEALGLSRRKLRVASEALAAWRLAPCGVQEDDDEDGGASWLGQAEGREKPASEHALAEEELARALGELALMDPREASVLRLRYGLEGDRPLTLQEIGERLGGLTRERARQLGRQGLERLQGALAAG